MPSGDLMIAPIRGTHWIDAMMHTSARSRHPGSRELVTKFLRLSTAACMLARASRDHDVSSRRYFHDEPGRWKNPEVEVW